jgi:hypothetical protein
MQESSLSPSLSNSSSFGEAQGWSTCASASGHVQSHTRLENSGSNSFAQQLLVENNAAALHAEQFLTTLAQANHALSQELQRLKAIRAKQQNQVRQAVRELGMLKRKVLEEIEVSTNRNEKKAARE